MVAGLNITWGYSLSINRKARDKNSLVTNRGKALFFLKKDAK
jgi:hypothetical protein